MKAGREIDALIAEKVMGWPKNSVVWYIDDKPFRISDFSPSTQIADAWLVVEKIKRENLQIVWDIDGWFVSSIYADTGFAPTAPLAICLAALKATGD